MSMKDFKNAMKSWVLKNFPVKQGIEMIYGISFKQCFNTIFVENHVQNV